MIKVLQGLEKNRGLSIWIFNKIEDAPRYCNVPRTMMRDEILEYHLQSAVDFWDFMRQQPADFKWETIINDKRTFKL